MHGGGYIFYAGILVILGLLLVVLAFYITVCRRESQTNNLQTSTTPSTTTTTTTAFKSRWRTQEFVENVLSKDANGIVVANEDGKLRISGDNKRILIRGQVAVSHEEGSIDDPVLSNHNDKVFLTYTTGGGRGLYYTSLLPGTKTWTPPTSIAAGDRIQNVSSFPIIYRLDGKHLCTVHSTTPIATFEFNPLDDSEPAVLNDGQGLVLLVYSVKDRGLCRMRSLDSGKTWSASHLVVADALAFRPTLHKEGSHIHLVYLSLDSSKMKEAQLYYTCSKDNGITFNAQTIHLSSGLTLPPNNHNYIAKLKIKKEPKDQNLAVHFQGRAFRLVF